MSKPHTNLVNAIRVHMSKVGALPVKVDTPGLLYSKDGKPVRIGTAGTWDTVNCLDGRFIAIEAKIGTDKLSPQQKKWGAAVRRAGGMTIVAWSVDDVIRRLEQEGLTPCN